MAEPTSLQLALRIEALTRRVEKLERKAEPAGDAYRRLRQAKPPSVEAVTRALCASLADSWANESTNDIARETARAIAERIRTA